MASLFAGFYISPVMRTILQGPPAEAGKIGQMMGVFIVSQPSQVQPLISVTGPVLATLQCLDFLTVQSDGSVASTLVNIWCHNKPT